MPVIETRSVLQRLAVVHCVTAGACVLAAAGLAWAFFGSAAAVAAVGVVLVATALLFAADYLVLRGTLRPLARLSEALTAIGKGERTRPLPDADGEPTTRSVSLAVSEMLERIDGESRAYSSKIFESIEQERRRIGRELHDDTSQSLAAALLRIDVALKGMATCPAEVHAEIDKAQKLIHYCLDQLRVLVHDLRPSMLDDFGLAPTLRWYVQSHLDTEALDVDVDIEAIPERLPPAVETGLYRIAQESLANVQKHSAATRVQLRLEIQPGYATLLVADNGRGFDPEEVLYDREGRYGVGLLSIRERAELLGGTTTVVSSQDAGTRVHVVVPIDREAR